MATAEQLAAFQTAVASGNIQEAANIAASAGYSPQQVAEYVNANAPILGLGPETGFSGVTAANLDPYFAAASAPVVAAPPPPPPPPPVVVQEQGDPLKGALALYDQYLLAGQYPEAKALLDSTIATYGLNPTESYANIATYLNTEPKFEGVRKAAENKLFTSENIANFGKPLPPAPVGSAGGIYQRTPQEQAAYESQLASIPVNTAVPLPVMPMSLGPSAAMARIQRTGEMTPEQYYSNIRESVSSGQYTPAQLRQMQQGVGASSQDINVAFGRGMTPITTTTPTMPGATADTTQSIGQFIQSRAPTTSVAMPTAPSMFSPENVRAQLELERLRLQPTPEEPVAGFAQGGLVGDDINRMLQNQRNAIQRESQSRQMLSTLGAPPVKKFSDGGPAGSSSDDMFVGTRPEDFPETSPVDEKAAELLRALSEGTRGFVGADPIEPGSEAYRTGQALANMPVIGVAAGTIKGAGKAKDALKALTKKDIKLIASELETSRGQLAELVKKYPQLRDASVADIEALTKGEPFTAFRGISLLPGRELRKESTPSMTVDSSVALGMLKDAPVMITKEGFITATPVLRQYPGMKASETQVYVPSLIEQITERQPGALEMKIPTRSGEKMTVADVFKEVKGEKELLADVSKKEPRDILFDRYQGGVGDRYLMEVARRVLAGKWDGGEALLKEIGGYQTDPKGLVQEFDSFAELVKESALKKAKGGEVTNDEFIQEMMTGTRPSDFPETSPVDTAVSDYIKFQSKAVTDPKAYMQALGENIKKYHTDPLQQDPQKYLMEQLGPGQGLMGAIKPRGGIMPTTPGTPWGEYIDEVVGAAQKSYANIADDRREGVVDFIKKKLGKYIRSDFGTEEDPLRRAVESGRLETFGKDKDTFRSYALKAAREGDPDAVYDVTKAYDTGTGIRPTVMLPTRDFDEGQLVKQKAVNDLVSKIVAEGGDPEIARSIVERQLRSVSRDETDKALQTGEEGYSRVLKTFGVDENRPKDMGFFERALDQGDIAYGKDFLNLQFLRPQDLAEALGAIPSNKLASMDFPEAVVEGNRLMKKSRDLDENIKIAEKGKGSTLPKEILFFGTKPLKTPAKSGQWINITDPDAARLEGALMRHSVHGYGKDGPYGLGGKQALLSGKANLFSLRDEKGLPMVTVEMENMALESWKSPSKRKMSDREARKTPDFKVRQVQGKFNSAPEDYIDDVFDLAETINGRWSEGPAGNQRYGKDRSGKDLDEPKIIEWGKLFANRKAQGKAAGGEITKFIKDNR